MSDHVTINVEPLTLDNLCDGRVAAQFQSALDQVAQAFEDEELTGGREKISAKVLVEIELAYKPESGSLSIAAKVKTALPERRKVGTTALLRGGRFLVEPDNQLELYTHEGGAQP